MSRIQFFLVLAVYILGSVACGQWALALDKTWMLGFVLWSSFFGFINAIGWMAYWSREHWLG